MVEPEVRYWIEKGYTTGGNDKHVLWTHAFDGNVYDFGSLRDAQGNLIQVKSRYWGMKTVVFRIVKVTREEVPDDRDAG